MHGVGIYTLGQVALEGGRLARQHQPTIMLTYLAHEGRRDREHLAQLFWPTAKRPLNNLSSSLSRIRQVAPEALVIGTHQINTNWRTDANYMLDLLRDGDVAQALALYRGPFLDGFKLRTLGEELENWIYETRDRISATIADAAISESNALLSVGRWSDAADMAEHAVTVGGHSKSILDNLDFLYGLLAGSSRLAAQSLRSDAEAIGYDLDHVELLRPPREPRAETNHGDFLGRQDELAKLASLARIGRVVNLHGLGGSGKSTLIRHFVSHKAERSGAFPGGCHVVALAAETNSAAVVTAVRAALQPQAPPGEVDDVAAMISEPTLLVIDDLVPSDQILETLVDLSKIDDLCTVVLSRLRIDAPFVHSLKVAGLSTSQDVGRSEAARLFTSLAGSRLEIDEPTQPISQAIEAICEQVSGLPLALELTSAWLRLLPLTEVVALFKDEEVLEQAPPGENLSLGLVIRRTWDMLAVSEQEALSRLSMMRGGFTRTASREASNVPLNELTKLNDYSLIDVQPDGRMTLHPLISDFAAKALAADPERLVDAQQSYQQFFASMLDEAVSSLSGPNQGATLQTILQDHRNICGAWAGLVEAGDWDAVTRTLQPFDIYLQRTGQLVEALSLFERAIEAFENSPTSAGRNSLHAQLLKALAWFQMLVGRDRIALEKTTAGLAVVPASDKATHISLLRTKCALLGNSGNMAAALQEYLVARELAEELGDDAVRILIREDIGRCHASLGDHVAAEKVFRENLDVARDLGDPHLEARSYYLLGHSGAAVDPARALVLLDQGAAVAKANGLSRLQAFFPQARGSCYLALRQPAQAALAYGTGVELADAIGDQIIRTINLCGLGRAQLRQGEIDAAIATIEDVVHIAVRTNGWASVLGLGLGVANAAASLGQNELAASLYHFCAAHPLTYPDDLELERVTNLAEPSTPIDVDSRLDETCERILQLARSLI